MLAAVLRSEALIHSSLIPDKTENSITENGIFSCKVGNSSKGWYWFFFRKWAEFEVLSLTMNRSLCCSAWKIDSSLIMKVTAIEIICDMNRPVTQLKQLQRNGQLRQLVSLLQRTEVLSRNSIESYSVIVPLSLVAVTVSRWKSNCT